MPKVCNIPVTELDPHRGNFTLTEWCKQDLVSITVGLLMFQVVMYLRVQLLPAPGDEGSNPLDISLHALEACSESFFFELPSADLCDFFLFFTRILYIKSIGLGRGTPVSSLKEREICNK